MKEDTEPTGDTWIHRTVRRYMDTQNRQEIHGTSIETQYLRKLIKRNKIL